jgi:ubiquinone/menaquinone biosynthesis C-methylase UbiE
MAESMLAPNHHADHPGFSGLRGFVAAVVLTRGRDSDATLAIRLAELTAGDRLVDVGSGPGVAARRAASLGAEVVAVDPAAVMLRVGRLANRAKGLRYALGAAQALPVADGWASVVWSLATVHHWPDIDAALGEISRVLAPGGRFVAIERHVADRSRGLASHGWTRAQADAFAARFEAPGLSATVDEHADGNRGEALSVVALMPRPATHEDST